MNSIVVHVSEAGLIITRNEEAYLLQDPLEDEPIQWSDSLDELRRIIQDIELNPFKVGDKVRVKRADDGNTYLEGTADTVYYIRNNGAMCIEFYDDGISSCLYTWQDLEAYKGDSSYG